MTQKTSPSYARIRNKEQDDKLENMEWPGQTPDVNPIELFWDELDRNVKARKVRT